MHCSSSPKMVCETKIVAEERAAIPGDQKDAMMWTSSTGPGPVPVPGPGKEEGGARRDEVLIREFARADREEVRRIFSEGILERVPNTAFRGLRERPRAQLLYALLTVMCFYVTRSVALTCCAPLALMAARYYYSRKVIHGYLDCALNTDMADIEAYYMRPTGSCFWVALLEGRVVGLVAARALEEEEDAVELRRMSVDARYRGKGIAKALGRRVLEFAVRHDYGAVVLGTTAVKLAAHKLYESLGFRQTGRNEDHRLPGMSRSPLERLFFQIRHCSYRLQLREE
ncbi:LOW QUALITY PROTEIN: N-acetylaspartate synthetase [Menidia menidia]